MSRHGVAITIGILLGGALACSSEYGEGAPPGAPDPDAGMDAASGDSSAAALEVPAGWSLVLVASGCPAEFPEAREYVDNPRAPTTACTCSCRPPTGNPCVNGSTVVDVRNGGSNCNDVQFTAITDGACHAIGLSTSSWNAASLAPRPPAQVTCSAGATMPPALLDDGTVIMCRASSSSGSLAPPAGSTACVVRPGTDPCPTGWPSRRVLVPADQIMDERTCVGCTCQGSATCADPQLAFYTESTCTAPAGSVAASSTCNAFVGDVSRTHYRYGAKANVTCTPTIANVPQSGEVKLGARETMCCR